MEHMNCEQLVADYVAWLKAGITTAEVNGACEITTPFLDRHNDHLQIYVVRGEHGTLRLSDDGYILGDLEVSGCNPESPARQKMLTAVLAGFGIQLVDGELQAVCAASEFPRTKHLLLQAMLAVNDLFMTSKRSVTSMFLEDVGLFLDSRGVRATPKVAFTGQSGFPHHFDFAIPKSKGAPERLIRAINQPTRENAGSFLFAWSDTRQTREADSQAFVFLNDGEQELKADVVEAFKKYGVTPVRWSDREQFTEQLAR